jgi:D-amino-acid dehydrogenase
MADHKESNVLIIGGGVIGCSIAYALARRGAGVTVVERGQIGHGCSYGNAGWLVPSHAMPLPMPGALKQAAKWMMRKDSPLYIKPRLSPAMASWLVRFLLHANERHLEYAVPILVSLGLRSLDLIETFISEHGGEDLDFAKRGLLYVCKTDAGLKDAVREMDALRSVNLTGEVLEDAALREREPAVRGPTVGGIFLENQAHIEPLRFVEALAREAERMGVTFLSDTEVFAFERGGETLQAVKTTRGRLTAGEFVVAAGSWTPALARQAGLRAPIEAGKGYALIYDGLSPSPRIPLLLVERKVAVTPRKDSVRLAGTMELAGMNESITGLRVEAIARAAREYLQMSQDPVTTEIWGGLRPCTPDGLPLVGRCERWKNLTLAAGHAMLGLTLSTGTGELVAQLLSGETPFTDPEPFRPSRF